MTVSATSQCNMFAVHLYHSFHLFNLVSEHRKRASYQRFWHFFVGPNALFGLTGPSLILCNFYLGFWLVQWPCRIKVGGTSYDGYATVNNIHFHTPRLSKLVIVGTIRLFSVCKHFFSLTSHKVGEAATFLKHSLCGVWASKTLMKIHWTHRVAACMKLHQFYKSINNL